ncbi:type III ribulose-bisphosphate carboxylase [Archaeoglobus veneficus]|uniref:Ribulose bisphosphate carboxylase n=1 Tax=Archaeoglobus veneficus (strain DSM 11195 / SNP6) TaxID=693661 RepID=F2KRW1_ARCVS|nr:type III ribulose-bisphosphate carboxylase [Archaeoglobus veneficus]AEA46802.1 ribulose bisphosphate carboxylase, type III [Archaeoglobus veneficus SNP6]
MSFEWYTEFVDLSYEPEENEIICVFRVEPDGISMEEAAGRVASESSVGTWTTLAKLPERIKRLMAKVFEIDGNVVKIAYPLDLFEEGSIPQLLSSVAGNVFGMKALKNLRLEDIEFPAEYCKHFSGPLLGIEGVRKLFGVYDRPLTATVPKPKVGFDADEYADIAYQGWSGGIDFIKDDENLTSQPFVRFEKRLEKVMKAREKAEKETGEKKVYLANVTAVGKEMLRRAKLVADYGNEYVMVDILTAGFSAVQMLREECEDLGLGIHAHRAMHAAFTRNPKHGISLDVLVKISRLAGVDNFHVGTGVGKMEGSKDMVKRLADICRREWYVKPVFPVSSGGLHPGLVPDIVQLFGKDVIIQAGGGVHGHPDGTHAGAKALRQAIDAVIKGISLDEHAKKHAELARALEKWGYTRPK